MLTKNVWQTKGLYNGALGTVRGIVYREGVKQPAMPQCVLVEFDDYQGPRIDPEHNIVPIVPETIQFDSRTGKSNASREQLPLVLGWAITIHKSQGLTLKEAVVDVGPKETHLGISYVGCSRVKSFEGLAFNRSFTWDRMDRINKSKALVDVKNELTRLAALVDQT
jgi:ATP-dependent DNA helicase PIF1